MEPSISFLDFASRLREFIRQSSAIDPYEAPGKTCGDQEIFGVLARSLFELQFRSNEVYRKVCLHFGMTPDRARSWQEFPALPSRMFKEFDVTSLDPRERSHVFHSSGTTEAQRSSHFHSTHSLALYEASVVAWFQHQALSRGGPPKTGIILTPPASMAPHSSLVAMFQAIARSQQWPGHAFLGEIGPAGEWTIPGLKAAQAIAEAARLGPVLLLGTSLLFASLAECLLEQNIRLQLPAGSALLHTGGYKGRSRSIAQEELEPLLARLFYLPPTGLITEYGMTELSSQAYKARAAESGGALSDFFRFPPWARARVISPETGAEVAVGEKGLLQVCDLANVYSVMMLQTEDLALRRPGGFDLAGRAEDSDERGCSLMSL